MAPSRCVLGGCRARHVVLACSVRNDGKSLAELARRSLGASSGSIASLAIFFIVIIALSGLGVVVVKALGGEEVKLPAGTRIELASAEAPANGESAANNIFNIGRDAKVIYPSGATLTRSSAFQIKIPGDKPAVQEQSLHCQQAVPKLSRELLGMFTIACTIPIALS